jgi:DNA-directed RNA polymerase subunit RPC12/RpoP
MNANNWLADLPEYDCPTCGDKTIFKNQCSDCEQKQVDAEDLATLPKEIQDIDNEINQLKLERAKKIGEYEALKRRMK